MTVLSMYSFYVFARYDSIQNRSNKHVLVKYCFQTYSFYLERHMTLFDDVGPVDFKLRRVLQVKSEFSFG